MEHKNTLQLLKENYKVVLRLFKYSRDFRKSYIVALLINAFTMVRLTFVVGFSVQWVTDSAISKDWAQMEKALYFAVIAFAVNSVLYFFEGYLMQTRVEMIMAKVKKELLDKVMRLSAEYHDENHSGDLQSRLTSDISSASDAISFTLVDPINFGVLGIVNLILIALISYKMAFICVLLVISVIIFNTLFLKKIQQSSEKIQATISAATERYSDIINGISIIKIFSLEQWIYNRFDKESKEMLFFQSKLTKILSGQKSINGFIDNICTIGMVGIGAVFLAQGEFTTGALLAIFRYVSNLVFAFTGFGQVLSDIAKCLVGANRVMEILDLPEEKLDETDVKPDMAANKVLVFDNISFGYGNGTKVIENFSARISKGEKIAIVGPSGAGKTTIFKLIMGFYPLLNDSGRILLYGKDIRDYSLSVRRQLFSYVCQSNYLFTGTIKENIAFGREGASDEEIIQAATAAYAHDFITGLPQGYETQVGENGAFLSGGEKQRIAIARAILKDASILLLDEPTAALDSESEYEVQKALEVLMKGRTVIVVAHRLSTVKNSDRIIVLENGCVVEEDSHNELLKLNKRYAYYYNLLVN